MKCAENVHRCMCGRNDDIPTKFKNHTQSKRTHKHNTFPLYT